MQAGSLPLQVEVNGNQVLVRRGKNDEFWQQYDRGAWEPDTQTVFKRFIDRQHSYIDIGAWIGSTLLLGGQLARCAYGIEPDPIAYAELAENIALNPQLASSVRLYRLCISPTSGQQPFGSQAEGGDSMSSLLFLDGRTRWTVEGVTFVEFVERNGIDDCNFIKIDIEGGEYRVVPTMVEYLKRYRPTIHLSLHPCFLGDLEARSLKDRVNRSILRLTCTIKLLTQLRFYKYCYDPLSRYPSELLPTRLSRVHCSFAKLNWKPVAWLLSLGESLYGMPSALVLSDESW
jgi:FkbM family methyltransferase